MVPLCAVTVALAMGCPESAEPEPLPPSIAELNTQRSALPAVDGDPAPRLLLAFTLGERGDLRPCACPDGVTGGFARRATFVDALREEIDDLLVIAGPESLAPGRGESGLASAERTGSLLALHGAGGTDTVALGAPDLAGLTPADLTTLVEATGLTLLATNLQTGDGASLPVERVQILEAGDRRVALMSLMDPAGGTLARTGFTVDSPTDAIASALAGMASPPDAVIAFTDASPRRASSLAQRWSGVDFVIGGASRSGPGSLQDEEGARTVAEDPSGLRLGLLDLVFAGGASGTFVDDERVRDIVSQRLAEYTARVRIGWVGEESGESVDRTSHDERIQALGRSLPAGTLEGHAYGYRSAPLLKVIPQNPGVLDQVDRYYARR